MKTAWKFTATSSHYGKLKATTTDNSLLVNNGVFEFLIREPYYENLKIINPENKSYTQTTVTTHAVKWTDAPVYPKLKKLGTGKLFGHNCQHYKFANSRQSIDAWYTRSIMNDKLASSISRLCAVPVGYGMPLKIQINSGSGPKMLFKVHTMTKLQIPLNSLSVPKSYRLIRDQALFYFANEDGTNSGIDEFFRTPYKKSKKH